MSTAGQPDTLTEPLPVRRSTMLRGDDYRPNARRPRTVAEPSTGVQQVRIPELAPFTLCAAITELTHEAAASNVVALSRPKPH
jgi:hypothetical protein